MRRRYLDSIRSLTIGLVVIYHVLYMYTGIEGMKVAGSFAETQYQDAIMYLLYPYFMVLMFTISGMSSNYYLQNRSTIEFRRSRTHSEAVGTFHPRNRRLRLDAENCKPEARRDL
jgi:fucose 4-O-acetylase-like acetyltransferase